MSLRDDLTAMNPQPVSLADELRKRLDSLNKAFLCAYIECPAEVVDDLRQRFQEYLAALLDQHAQPEVPVGLTTMERKVIDAAKRKREIELGDVDNAIEELGDAIDALDAATDALLTSPVAPPAHDFVRESNKLALARVMARRDEAQYVRSPEEAKNRVAELDVEIARLEAIK